MKSKIFNICGLAGTFVSLLTVTGGCSTTEISPDAPPAPTPPPYVQVPHPTGTDLADLRAIFLDRAAPTLESIKHCDVDFKRLKEATASEDERKEGFRQLVALEPVQYHWCFYGKILEIEEALKKSVYLDERQKQVLDNYQFLVPMSRAFMDQFQDSRYLRWAISHYRKISEWVFYRRVEVSPGQTSELVEVANPFGLWREPANDTSVLEKYGIMDRQPAKDSTPDGAETAAPPATAPEAGLFEPTQVLEQGKGPLTQ